MTPEERGALLVEEETLEKQLEPLREKARALARPFLQIFSGLAQSPENACFTEAPSHLMGADPQRAKQYFQVNWKALSQEKIMAASEAAVAAQKALSRLTEVKRLLGKTMPERRY